MSDTLKEILYGKTSTVTLADGNQYVVREPTILDLEEINLSKDNMGDPKNILELTWVMMKQDNNGLSKEKLGRLITFGMLKDKSDFLKTIFYVLGVVPEGNAVAGTA